MRPALGHAGSVDARMCGWHAGSVDARSEAAAVDA